MPPPAHFSRFVVFVLLRLLATLTFCHTTVLILVFYEQGVDVEELLILNQQVIY